MKRLIPIALLCIGLTILFGIVKAQSPSGGYSSPGNGSSSGVAGCQTACRYTLTNGDSPSAAGGTGSTLTANNQGAFTQFYNNANRNVTTGCFLIVGTSASGNVDIGIYSIQGITGTLIWHTGAKSTTSAGTQCATAAAVTLAAGQNYYLAWVADNTAVTLSSVTASGNYATIAGSAGATANTYGLNASDPGSGGVLPSTITITHITNNTAKALTPWLMVFNP